MPLLRHSVRAILLDQDQRVLLYRCPVPREAPAAVWVTPGGGIEAGETPLGALRRELHEETGFLLDTDPPHVWHQRADGKQYLSGYEGVINDYFLVRTTAFEPHGAMSDEDLAAESLTDWRWWPPPDLRDYRGPDLFSPRDLIGPLSTLLAEGPPAEPARLGL